LKYRELNFIERRLSAFAQRDDIPAFSNRVNGTGVFYAKGASHAGTIAQKQENVKIKDLTLGC
jgi:hypothetical protein